MSRARSAALAALVVASALAAAPALAGPAALPVVKPAGVGGVGLGKLYSAMRAEHRVGPLRAGCELAGPQARSARLLAPLRGSVDLTDSAPRTVRVITVRGGATARGVGVGASEAKLRRAFPGVRIDRSTVGTFGIALATVPKGAGGRLQFALGAETGKVTLIGIPRIPFCE